MHVEKNRWGVSALSWLVALSLGSSALAQEAAETDTIDAAQEAAADSAEGEAAAESAEQAEQDAEAAADSAEQAEQDAEAAADSAEQAEQDTETAADSAEQAEQDAEAAAADPALPPSSPSQDPSVDAPLIPGFTGGPQTRREETSPNSFHTDIDLRARNQPLGLVVAARMYNEHEYMRGNAGALFDPVYVRTGVSLNVSPAFAEVGFDFEWSPIRIFALRAQYLGAYYFGTFEYIYSYDNPNPVTLDNELDARSGDEETGFVHRFEIAPTLQFAFGNLAFRNTFTWQRSYYANSQFEGPYIRENWYDRMITTGGDSVIANSLIFLYKVWDPDGSRDAQLMIGPFHEWVRGVGVTNIPGVEDNRHRVGATLVYIPKHNWGNFYRPRLLMQVGNNIVDRDNGRDGRWFVQGSMGFTLHGNRR